ncbi:MAG TPA: hypothetical protein VF551_07015 [Chthoniobacterales bacterium]
MGTPRMRDEAREPAADEPQREEEPTSAPAAEANPASEVAEPERRRVPRESAAPTAEKPDELDAPAAEVRETRRPRSAAPVVADQKSSRLAEMRTPLLVIGVLILLACTFYFGKKFEYWKYRMMTARNAPKLEDREDKFPNASVEELIAQALASEQAGNLQDATERLLAAKHKDLQYRGILFRVGKIAHDHGDFDNADRLFERAIAFGENVDLANYMRGLIAVRRKDLAGAQRFFAEAARYEPFTADYHYYQGEALRMDHKPTEAIPLYERAALLARNSQDTSVALFKVQMARLEAAEAPKVAEEIATREASGEMPVDWLMTAAALHIRQGNIGEGVRYLNKARDGNNPGLFGSCAGDMFFFTASQTQPLVAEACRVAFDPNANPFQ